MSIAVVSCVYGEHRRFVADWADCVRSLDPAPDEVILITDRPMRVKGVKAISWPCNWKYPQAFYLNEAFAWVTTDWAVIADIDDLIYRDALRGLDQVPADVWQMGFDRSDGQRYIPPECTNEEFLASNHCFYVGSSAVRVSKFFEVGGFRDVAYQDWDLWRRMAEAGAMFQVSGRTHFSYERHPATRGAIELTSEHRAEHLAEMMENRATAI